MTPDGDSLNSISLMTITQQVCTCLPSLDAEFLSGHLPTQIFYLSEALASTENICFSPLAECAILVTICGRAQIHKQASKVEQALDTVSQDFWVRHDWLHCMLTKRMESFSSNHNPSSILEDPMLMFTFMGFQATLIYLCKIMESLEPLEQFEAARREYQDRALAAAREIARCSRELSHMGYFKVWHNWLKDFLPRYAPGHRMLLTKRTGPRVHTDTNLSRRRTTHGPSYFAQIIHECRREENAGRGATQLSRVAAQIANGQQHG